MSLIKYEEDSLVHDVIESSVLSGA